VAWSNDKTIDRHPIPCRNGWQEPIAVFFGTIYLNIVGVEARTGMNHSLDL